MKNNSNPVYRRKPERGGKSKGVKERQDSEHSIISAQHENLGDLADIGQNIVVRKHHAFGVSGAAAGKNDRREVLRCAVPRPQRLFQESKWQGPGKKNRRQFFADPRRPSISSSRSVRPGTSIPGKRSRKALEVTTVCNLHCRAQEFITSLFAV